MFKSKDYGKELIENRKLILICDLDETLVTSVKLRQSILDINISSKKEILQISPRPHIDEFLKEISLLFELHISTFSPIEHANCLLKVIDSENKYFKSISSKDDMINGVKTENLKSKFSENLDMICIIDDRMSVWNGCNNLIKIKPYNVFKSIKKILKNDPKYSKINTLSKLEEEYNNIDYSDDYLLRLKESLKSLHEMYFKSISKNQNQFTDIAPLIKSVKNEIKCV